MTNNIETRFLTRKETADFLRLSVKTLSRMEERKEIKPIRFGGKIMYSVEYLDEWLMKKQNDKN